MLRSCNGARIIDVNQHILVVDDDYEIRDLVSAALHRSGYRVSVAENGTVMAPVLAASRIDLVVLDIMMPGENGLSICRRLRAEGSMPIIMLTAAGHEADRVIGLETGADDYLTKPFSTQELIARIRSLLRRAAMPVSGSPSDKMRVFEFAGWRLDATRRRVCAPSGALVDLRAAEFDLLLALVERPNHVLTRDQLLDLARGRASNAFDRSIDVHISRLRHRMEKDPKNPEMIQTVRSGGYVFSVPVMLNGRKW